MSDARERSAWACLLTPAGRGAVAVVRVWGRDALAVADAAFRPRQGAGLATSPRGRLRLGRMGSGLGDEVVAVVLEGEPAEVEIHCHGGPAPVDLVVQALTAQGSQLRKQEAWSLRRAGERIAALASLDLASAPTVRTAEILLDQVQGALETEIRRLVKLVAVDPLRTSKEIDDLIMRSEIGLRLISGWRVVLSGRPNVGKSQLLNALAGYERAIVDPQPGTTRDVVTVRTAIDGWPVELTDTAGMRATTDPTEASGVDLALAQQAGADLIVLVLDRSEPLTNTDRSLVARHPRALRVANKSDLPSAWEPRQPGCLTVSALTGDGIDALCAAIARRLVPNPPPPGSGVPFRASQVRLLAHARRWLAHDRTAAAATDLVRLISTDMDHVESLRP